MSQVITRSKARRTSVLSMLYDWSSPYSISHLCREDVCAVVYKPLEFREPPFLFAGQWPNKADAGRRKAMMSR